MRQYRETVRLLDWELGVAPASETRALHDAIEAGTLGDEPVVRHRELEPFLLRAGAHEGGDVLDQLGG